MPDDALCFYTVAIVLYVVYMFWSTCSLLDSITYSPLSFLGIIPRVCAFEVEPCIDSWAWSRDWLPMRLHKQQQCPAELLPRITYQCMAPDERKLRGVKRNTIGVWLLFAHIEPLLEDCFSMILFFCRQRPNAPISTALFCVTTYGPVWWKCIYIYIYIVRVFTKIDDPVQAVKPCLSYQKQMQKSSKELKLSYVSNYWMFSLTWHQSPCRAHAWPVFFFFFFLQVTLIESNQKSNYNESLVNTGMALSDVLRLWERGDREMNNKTSVNVFPSALQMSFSGFSYFVSFLKTLWWQIELFPFDQYFGPCSDT